MKRHEQKAAKLVRLIAEASELLREIPVYDRAANEASILKKSLEDCLLNAEMFKSENAEYTADECEED